MITNEILDLETKCIEEEYVHELQLIEQQFSSSLSTGLHHILNIAKDSAKLKYESKLELMKKLRERSNCSEFKENKIDKTDIMDFKDISSKTKTSKLQKELDKSLEEAMNDYIKFGRGIVFADGKLKHLIFDKK